MEVLQDTIQEQTRFLPRIVTAIAAVVLVWETKKSL